jgi:hypothetical protein
VAGAVAGGGLALALLVAALLVGPLPALAQAPAAQPAPAPGSATLLRLAQLTPELKGVELVVASVADPRKSLIVAALGYGELSPYKMVEPGDYVIGVRPAGSTQPSMVSRTLSVRAGMAQTVAAVNGKTSDALQVFTDDLAPPAPDRTRLRVINAAPPSPQLDVRNGSGPFALALPCGQASPYQEVAPGTVQLSATPPGGGTSTALPVTVAPNQVVSVVLTSDNGSPRAMAVVDAGGPAVVPPGAVHAGYGGTAGPPPGAAVGSAVLAVLAAVAAAVSVRLARRAG